MILKLEVETPKFDLVLNETESKKKFNPLVFKFNPLNLGLFLDFDHRR